MINLLLFHPLFERSTVCNEEVFLSIKVIKASAYLSEILDRLGPIVNLKHAVTFSEVEVLKEGTHSMRASHTQICNEGILSLMSPEVLLAANPIMRSEVSFILSV